MPSKSASKKSAATAAPEVISLASLLPPVSKVKKDRKSTEASAPVQKAITPAKGKGEAAKSSGKKSASKAAAPVVAASSDSAKKRGRPKGSLKAAPKAGSETAPLSAKEVAAISKAKATDVAAAAKKAKEASVAATLSAAKSAKKNAKSAATVAGAGASDSHPLTLAMLGNDALSGVSKQMVDAAMANVMSSPISAQKKAAAKSSTKSAKKTVTAASSSSSSSSSSSAVAAAPTAPVVASTTKKRKAADSSSGDERVAKVAKVLLATAIAGLANEVKKAKDMQLKSRKEQVNVRRNAARKAVRDAKKAAAPSGAL